jgi:hypothetical protein
MPLSENRKKMVRLDAYICTFGNAPFFSEGDSYKAKTTYTRCLEDVSGYHPVVGDFSKYSLRVSRSIYDEECIGIAGVLKFQG